MQSCAVIVSDIIRCIADTTQVCSFYSLSPFHIFIFIFSIKIPVLESQ